MGGYAAAAGLFLPSRVCHCSWVKRKKKKKTRKMVFSTRARAHDTEDAPFLQAAINAASLRFRETHRPRPLFLDLYAGCFLSSITNEDMKQYLASTTSPCHYCMATKFIDDKLLNMLNHIDGLRQIVLLTDGMDTRPYRLSWPQSTIIFDISPEGVFKIASERLQGIGAKISRTCMHLHIPFESSDIQQILLRKGFNGSRSSLWVFQGLPVITLRSFKEILYVISSLAAKGSIFVGELPACLVETEFGSEEWLEKLFMSNGFRVDMINIDEVAKSLHVDPPLGAYGNILFVAWQLQLSDDQMENWRREFQRIEEEGDEDGFEEL